MILYRTVHVCNLKLSSQYCTVQIVARYSYEYNQGWWWLQHPSKDDEACAISGKRTTNSKLNTSIIGGCGVGVRIVDFFSNIRA